MDGPANPGKVEGREAEVPNSEWLLLSVERGAGKRGFGWIIWGGIEITDAEDGIHRMSHVFFWGLIVKDGELELNQGVLGCSKRGGDTILERTSRYGVQCIHCHIFGSSR